MGGSAAGALSAPLPASVPENKRKLLALLLDSLLALRRENKEVLWSSMVKRHGLQPLPYDKLVDWRFADFQWHMNYDHISDTTKLFRAGFREMVDDEEMIVRMLRQLKEHRVIP